MLDTWLPLPEPAVTGGSETVERGEWADLNSKKLTVTVRKTKSFIKIYISVTVDKGKITYVSTCVRVRFSVRICVRVLMRVCVRICVRVSVLMRVCMFIFIFRVRVLVPL
uniref:Uncharacterized protein n=1 Tax=Cacopsylla melanoneura TaxID=428564 RepID=A0A8D8XDD0_9HEMI